MPPRNELGQEAVSALATSAVVVGGTVVLVFVIVAGADKPGPYLAAVAGGVAVLGLVLYLLRTRPSQEQGRTRPWWQFWKRAAVEKEPKLVVRRREHQTIGPETMQPPTAEHIRDLKEHGSTWVPNRTSSRH